MKRLVVLAALVACHKAKPDLVVVEVRAALPGATADVVASSVATPLERQLGSLPHLVEMTSDSTEGATTIRLGFDVSDPFAAEQGVQAAINNAATLLPRDLPVPPTYSAAQDQVAMRLLVAPADAEMATEKIAQIAGVGLVEECGNRDREVAVTIDAQQLAATGLTVADVRTAVAGANANDLAASVIAEKNGVPIRLRDVALVQDHLRVPDCLVVAPDASAVEIVIHAQTAGVAARVRASIAALAPQLGIHATEVPAMREAQVELAPDYDPVQLSVKLREALAAVGTGFFAEVRAGHAVLLANDRSYLEALRRQPGVVDAGEATAVVHVSGADPYTAAQAIADRLRQADLLVTTTGLTKTQVLKVIVDRDAAARLGVASFAIDQTLATRTGVIGSAIFTQTGMYRVTVRADADLDHLYVRSSAGAMVPLSAMAREQAAAVPLHVLHRGQFPVVDLGVRGDPRKAIGSVPADVRVEVEDR